MAKRLNPLDFLEGTLYLLGNETIQSMKETTLIEKARAVDQIMTAISCLLDKDGKMDFGGMVKMDHTNDEKFNAHMEAIFKEAQG